jgi:VanZ family protein
LLPLTLSYTALLAVASLIPSGAHSSGVWYTYVTPTTLDVLHAPAYAVLAGLVLLTVGRRWTVRPRTVLLVVAACLVFGLILEWLQQHVPGRSASTADIVANTVGVIFGVCACFAIVRLVRPKTLPS